MLLMKITIQLNAYEVSVGTKHHQFETLISVISLVYYLIKAILTLENQDKCFD